jgi:hypothetical protein
MNALKRISWLGVVVLLLMVLWSPCAFAYIDPGSGSFILQMLLAAFFTLMFMLRRVRMKISKVVSGLLRKKSPNAPEE